MKTFMLALMLLVVSGCSVVDLFSLDASNTRITTASFDGVIFDAANASQVGLMYEFNDPIVEYWTPTDAQVTVLEAGLIPFLQTDEDGMRLWDRLPTYRRQYLGIAFDEGERLIYANYFCSTSLVDWLNDFVSVEDGGDCFFHVLYNPATNTFLNLRVNGEA